MQEQGEQVRNGRLNCGHLSEEERKHIFPFQEQADVMFNSALIYELAVLKQYAEPALFEIESDCEEYTEAKRLLKFFDYFVGIGGENIPANSILREFIGGGCFRI